MTSSHDRQTGNGRRPFYFSFIHVLVNWSGALSSMSVKWITATSNLSRTLILLHFLYSVRLFPLLFFFLSFFFYIYISNKPRSFLERVNYKQHACPRLAGANWIFRDIKLLSNGSLEAFLSDIKMRCVTSSVYAGMCVHSHSRSYKMQTITFYALEIVTHAYIYIHT
jgi:hypothetical protein